VIAMSDHIENLLSEYMDDELNEEEKQIIEKHLAVCSDCNHRLHELRSLRKQILAAYLPIEIPSMIEEIVIEKIQQASIKKSTGALNLLAFLSLFAFGIMLMVTASPILTIGLPIFHSVYSIARGLIYAVPSIISALPYVVEVIIALIFCFIIFAILTLRYLVHTMGKTVRAEDI
jgi:predicted anti-sigma-YlaC factor YlaD